MSASPSYDNTVGCLSITNREDEMATFQPQLPHPFIRKRPILIISKPQEEQEDKIIKPSQLSRAINTIIRTLGNEEVSLVIQYLDRVISVLNKTTQSNVSFKTFTNDEAKNERVVAALRSIMNLIGFNCHDENYFSNDVEDMFKKTSNVKNIVKIFQGYYAPFNIENLKEKLDNCFDPDEVPKKAQTILKLKNLDDLREDMSINISEQSLQLSKGNTMFSGEFNSISYKNKQGNSFDELLQTILTKIQRGGDLMLVSIGTTGSGKSDTLFKGFTQKREKIEKDEALVIQVLEGLIDPGTQKLDSGFVHFECEYLQIFNEITFDLLKKFGQKSKEELVEAGGKTNFEWLQSSNGTLTKMEITDILSIRKVAKRAGKNKALLAVQDKIFERRSSFLLKCHYKLIRNEKDCSGTIVFCEMPGIEKLREEEKESLNNMKLDEKLFLSKTEFAEFWVKSYPNKRKSMMMKVLENNFLRNCETTVYAHISLDRKLLEETIDLFRYLKNFNETISIHRQTKGHIADDKMLANLLKQYEEIRELTTGQSQKSSQRSLIENAQVRLKRIENLQKEFMSSCLRLTPAALDHAIKTLPQIAETIKLTETVMPQRRSNDKNKKVPYSLSELPSSVEQKEIIPHNGVKSYSSPSSSLNGCLPKRRPAAIMRDPLFKYANEIIETELEFFTSKLSAEGRCLVCTLKGCQCHSQATSLSNIQEQKEELYPARKRFETPLKGYNVRENRLSRPKENFYGNENSTNPTPTKTPIGQTINLTRWKYRRAGSLQGDQKAVREYSLDRSFNEQDVKAKILENRNGFENVPYGEKEDCQDKAKMNESDCSKLLRQYKIEEYHERKILNILREKQDKQTLEELQKRENELLEEKKKKYFDSQRKKLEEMRRIKDEERRREREESEQREKEEAKKKKQAEKYHRKMKEKILSYKQKKILECTNWIMENEIQEPMQGKEEDSFSVIKKEVESMIHSEKELRERENEVEHKPVSRKLSTEESIPDITKNDQSAEIPDEEIIEEESACY